MRTDSFHWSSLSGESFYTDQTAIFYFPLLEEILGLALAREAGSPGSLGAGERAKKNIGIPPRS